MAESQVQYNYSDKAIEIELSLSKKRFAPYLTKAGYNEIYAFNLYLYNARLSKAFLFPLHILEVSLRNRINTIFKYEYSENWSNENIFRSILSLESLSALDKAIDRANTNQTDDVVATLSFDFWSNLFRSKYDRSLWQTHMQALLPNTTITRKDFQKKIKEINMFRNRIAHHEPIHYMNISYWHKNIIDVLGWLNSEIQVWTKHYSTVNAILRTSPSASGEPKPHFGERCDGSFRILNEESLLHGFPSERFILCQNNQGEVVSVIEHQHLLHFMMTLVDDDGKSLAIDLSDYTIADITNYLNINNNFQCCGNRESISKARNVFKQKNTNYIVVRDTNNVIGILAKAHRQY